MPSKIASYSANWQSLVHAVNGGKGSIEITLEDETRRDRNGKETTVTGEERAASLLAKFNSFKAGVRRSGDDSLKQATANVVCARQGCTVTFSLPEETWDALILEEALSKLEGEKSNEN